jgi:hypothetical protein
MSEQLDVSANIDNRNISNNELINQNQFKKEELLALRKKQIDARKEELVQVICRQTELTSTEALKQLEEYNYDCIKVLNKYFGVEHVVEKKASSTNQKIYGEIRNLMDTGAKHYRMEQEKTEYIQKKQNEMAQAHVSKTNDNKLPTVTE